MVDIFASAPGRLIAFPTHYLPPAAFYLEGLSDLERPLRALVTGVASQDQVIAQFQQTLDWGAFVYLFGDRLAELTVTGLTFGGRCLPGGVDAERHGADEVKAFYDTYAANARPQPLVLVLGVETTYECFLVGLSQALTDPEAGVGRFAMRLVGLPHGLGETPPEVAAP